ncbi:hypothetical protein L484_021810 [Morus notabilis]|uniref:Uncharacterized protein n=1 Tax=Morus notabilis TaxID=981085 RepID=W9QHW8_9ROSA|nr:hypothetical protein L484_021810 [Morus notabilis]
MEDHIVFFNCGTSNAERETRRISGDVGDGEIRRSTMNLSMTIERSLSLRSFVSLHVQFLRHQQRRRRRRISPLRGRSRIKMNYRIL